MGQYWRTLATKTVEGGDFTLQLQKIEADGHYVHETHFDYIIAGPNWLSGYLKAKGMDEQEIWEFWDEVTMQNVSDAWEEFYEKGRIY